LNLDLLLVDSLENLPKYSFNIYFVVFDCMATVFSTTAQASDGDMATAQHPLTTGDAFCLPLGTVISKASKNGAQNPYPLR
jgi:hypothetical protein